MKKYLKKLQFNRERIIFVSILAILVYVMFATLNVIAGNYQLQQRMDELAAENDILELQNQQLRYEITYYKTDAFVEKEARAKLGLQAPGENVVIFSSQVPEPQLPPEPDPAPGFAQAVRNNFGEWMFFFFRIDI